jgi:hypothetical protein
VLRGKQEEETAIWRRSSFPDDLTERERRPGGCHPRTRGSMGGHSDLRPNQGIHIPGQALQEDLIFKSRNNQFTSTKFSKWNLVLVVVAAGLWNLWIHGGSIGLPPCTQVTRGSPTQKFLNLCPLRRSSPSFPAPAPPQARSCSRPSAEIRVGQRLH